MYMELRFSLVRKRKNVKIYWATEKAILINKKRVIHFATARKLVATVAC